MIKDSLSLSAFVRSIPKISGENVSYPDNPTGLPDWQSFSACLDKGNQIFGLLDGWDTDSLSTEPPVFSSLLHRIFISFLQSSAEWTGYPLIHTLPFRFVLFMQT